MLADHVSSPKKENIFFQAFREEDLSQALRHRRPQRPCRLRQARHRRGMGGGRRGGGGQPYGNGAQGAESMTVFVKKSIRNENAFSSFSDVGTCGPWAGARRPGRRWRRPGGPLRRGLQAQPGSSEGSQGGRGQGEGVTIRRSIKCKCYRAFESSLIYFVARNEPLKWEQRYCAIVIFSLVWLLCIAYSFKGRTGV